MGLLPLTQLSQGARSSDHPVALAEVPGQPPIGRTVRIEAGDEVEILNDELMLAERDHVYEEALALVARMTRY